MNFLKNPLHIKIVKISFAFFFLKKLFVKFFKNNFNAMTLYKCLEAIENVNCEKKIACIKNRS